MKYLILIIMILAIIVVLPTVYYRIGCIIKRQKQSKEIYLTFDDGPSEEYTEELLDLLEKYNVKSTFFLVAEFAQKNANIIKRMDNEGHLIGMHTLSHENQMFKGYFGVKKEFEKSNEIFKNLGVNVELYRPPWGCFSIFTSFFAKKMGYRLVLWDVMAEDWAAKTTSQEIKEKLLKRVRGGDTICLHDGRGEDGAPGRTLEALKEAIPELIQEGFIFKKVRDGR